MIRQQYIEAILTIGALLMVSPSPASGDPLAPAPKVGVGFMISASSSPYKNHGNDINVIPTLSYTGERLNIRGPFAGFALYKDKTFTLNLTAEYVFDVDAFEESPALRGMNKREDTAMAGLDANYRFFERWRLDASIKSDVLGRHDGQQAALALSQKRRLHNTFFSPGVGVSWQSSNYNEFYYGVEGDEAAVGRPAYNPGSSIDWFLNFRVLHKLSDNLSLLANGSLVFLSENIQDSPIVTDDATVTGFISANYTF